MLLRTLGVGLVGVGFALVACSDDSATGGAGAGGSPAGPGSSSSSNASSGSGSGSTSTSTSGSTSSTASSTSASTSSTSTSASTSATSSSSSGGGMCALPDTTLPATCAEACQDLYDCAVLTCMTGQNCPGATGDPMEEAALIASCEQTCAQQPALVAIVNPGSCDTTIQTLSNVSLEFGEFCQNGLPSTTSSTSSSGATSSSSGGGGLCPLPDTTAPNNCTEACSDLYDCGELNCNGTDLCVGFDGTAMQKQAFVAQCVPLCNQQPLLVQFVDPTDCEGTVSTIEGASPQFAAVCANGP